MSFDEVCLEYSLDKTKVDAVRENILPDVAVERISDTFKALSDPTRLKIVLSLLQSELCVCEIAEAVGISQSAVSHQLRKLKDMRLVKRRKSSKMVFYSLDDEHILKLLTECINHVQEEFSEPLNIPTREGSMI